MPATLKLTRESVGIELRRGLFEISVDGKNAGTIKYNETVETPLGPGHHTLQIRTGRYSSDEQSFEASNGDVVSFRCHGAVLWPKYLASLVKPDLAISLKRE